MHHYIECYPNSLKNRDYLGNLQVVTKCHDMNKPKITLSLSQIPKKALTVQKCLVKDLTSQNTSQIFTKCISGKKIKKYLFFPLIFYMLYLLPNQNPIKKTIYNLFSQSVTIYNKLNL